MKYYIVSQEYIDGIYTDEGSTFGLDMQKELIRCKDCKQFGRYANAPKKYQHDGFCRWWERDTCLDYWCCGAEREEK